MHPITNHQLATERLNDRIREASGRTSPARGRRPSTALLFIQRIAGRRRPFEVNRRPLTATSR